MAVSKCVKCDGMFFELKEVTPRDSEFKLNFVQCATCGAVVGVLEYNNVGALLDRLARGQQMSAAINSIRECDLDHKGRAFSGEVHPMLKGDASAVRRRHRNKLLISRMD